MHQSTVTPGCMNTPLRSSLVGVWERGWRRLSPLSPLSSLALFPNRYGRSRPDVRSALSLLTRLSVLWVLAS
ncbi:hypothetical protein E2C01_002714 [Portunus trituberculatus]|uniref:Uncharacterized protein n=1 Tax=Portunus trituberculatus TaxID=210409 RepID=A0A5B7CNY7_PORTR|nr:hypothetical protein [Portunus trituberculatus]